uniref:Uncharacterized protein n=1 Tax=Hucho hucho TaxID=62062 RepID=A0A4W5K3P6_9TELE
MSNITLFKKKYVNLYLTRQLWPREQLFLLFQMDLIHSSGVLVIQHLQSNYRDYHEFLDFMTSVGDPRHIFSLDFPLWFQLTTKMIFGPVIGDWFHLIFLHLCCHN